MDQKIYGTQHWDTCPIKHVKKNMLEKKFEVSGFEVVNVMEYIN